MGLMVMGNTKVSREGEHPCPHCGMDPERWANMTMEAEDIKREQHFDDEEED